MKRALVGIILSATLLLAGCASIGETGGTVPSPTDTATLETGGTPDVSETSEASETPEASETAVQTTTPDVSDTPTVTGTAQSPVTGSETIDPALVGITWQWVRTEQPDGTFVEALDPSRYTLTFMADGNVAAQFDCNSGGGSYTVEGSNLSFGPMVTTLMACAGESQAEIFGEQLAAVTSYAVDGDTLMLTLVDGGTMTLSATGAGDSTEVDTEATPEEDPDTPVEGQTGGDLVGTLWGWTHTEYSNDTVVEADDPSRYTVRFEPDGTALIMLDCNSGSATYTQDEGGSLSFGPIISTRMACPEGSQANVFAQDLEKAVTYLMVGDQLAVSLVVDTGIMFFSPLE